MGRMFRIINDQGLPFSGQTRPVALAEPEPFVETGAPFIEVGGPNGPVMTLPKTQATAPKPASKPAPMPELPSRDPAPQRFLSVALHEIAPRPAEPLPSPVSPAIVAFHHPDHPVSEEYRILKNDLTRQVGTDGPRAILFASTEPDQGTTTVLLNLAATLAQQPDTRVLVLDAEFDRPGTARHLGLSNVPGLTEVLAAELPLAWALQPTSIPRLQALGSGAASTANEDQFPKLFGQLIGQLRQWFDWILVDGGVWGERHIRDEATPAFDGVYLVSRDVELERARCAAIHQQIVHHGGFLRGVISTRA